MLSTHTTIPKDSRVGDQFELDLFPGVPWGGRSPRGLTRVKISLFLRQEPPSHGVYPDPAQLDFWRRGSKATKRKRPPPTAGASTLLPLKKGRKSRPFALRIQEEE